MPAKPQNQQGIPCLVLYSHWSRTGKNMIINTLRTTGINESYVINTRTLASIDAEFVETESFPEMEMVVECESFPESFDVIEPVVDIDVDMGGAYDAFMDEAMSFDDATFDCGMDMGCMEL